MAIRNPGANACRLSEDVRSEMLLYVIPKIAVAPPCMIAVPNHLMIHTIMLASGSEPT